MTIFKYLEFALLALATTVVTKSEETIDIQPRIEFSQHQIVYILGQRVFEDRIVATSQNNLGSWNALQNVIVNMSSGRGATVNYVQIVVYQSLDQGRAYVVSGGIDKPFIDLAVEAYGTNFFNYTAQFYGQ